MASDDQLTESEESWHYERWRQDVAFQLTSELDRARWGIEASGNDSAFSRESVRGQLSENNDRGEQKSLLQSDDGFDKNGYDSDDSYMANNGSSQENNLPSRLVRAALSSSSSQSFFSDTVSLALIFVSFTIVLVHLRISGTLAVQKTSWFMLLSPMWVAAMLCISGSLRILLHAYCTSKHFGESYNRTEAPQRHGLSRSHVVDHINHVAFWIAVSISVVFLGTFLEKNNNILGSAATPSGFPALFIISPVLVAMCLQVSLYYAKNRSRTCGFYIPDGFPIDPLHVTMLFVAARLDELIMWDWNLVFWCPYVFWVIALYNSFVYGVVAADVVRTHRAQSSRPIQEQHYAMLVAPNTYVQPFWLAMRSVLRFVIALTVTICVFVSTHYGALRLNGAVDTVSTAAITLPLAVGLAVSGTLTLVSSWLVAPKVVATEPHRCSYCTRPIRLILQVDLGGNNLEGNLVNSSTGMCVAEVLRYENPVDSLTIDVTDRDAERQSDVLQRNEDGIVPLRLVKALGEAMWKEFQGNMYAGQGDPIKGGSNTGSSFVQNTGIGPGMRNFDRQIQVCTVCRTRQADCVFLDCGHAVQCWDCSRNVIRSRNRERRRAERRQVFDNPGDGI